MDLVPYGDLHRDIKAVHGTARYELLSGHLDGTGLPAATVGNGERWGARAEAGR